MKGFKSLIVLSGLSVSLLVSGVYADTQLTPNGYINTKNKIIPKQNNGYVPPNVQDSKASDASKKSKDAEKRQKADEGKTKDQEFQDIAKLADEADSIFSKGNPTVEELNTATSHLSKIKAYLSDEANKEYEGTGEFNKWKGLVNTYDSKFGELKEKADRIADANGKLEKAKTSNNPSDLSALTSYIYVEEGFFGTKDIFPKVVNALIQGLFFLTKMLYLLVVIILDQVFSANAYEKLDEVIDFSAKLFNRTMEVWKYVLLFGSLLWAIVEFWRRKRFPVKVFYFFVVWFLAMFLYAPASTGTQAGNQEIPAKYNLSKMIRFVDAVGSDFTKEAILGFNELDSDYQVTGSVSGDNFSQVREVIFDKIVYQAFLSLNFTSTDKNQVTDEMVTDLFATGGKTGEVETFQDRYPDVAQVSWSSIGVKFMVVLASLVKGLVIGFALVIIGLLSLVFKYLALLLIVSSVILFFLAMFPGLEHLIGSLGKKIVQFVFLGSLGLFFIRAFLFMDSLVEGASTSINSSYMWSSIIQGLIWFTIWKMRWSFGDLFVKGTLSVQEVARKAQEGINQFGLPEVSTSTALPMRILNRPNATDNVDPVLDDERVMRKPSRLSLLKEVGVNSTTSSLRKVRDFYDDVRYGKGDTIEKQLARESREQRKEQLSDGLEVVKDTMSLPKMEGLRSKVYEMAGVEDAPVQQSFRERMERKLERKERKENRLNEKEDFRRYVENREQDPSMKTESGSVAPVRERFNRRNLKHDFRRERLEKRQDSPVRFEKEENPIRERLDKIKMGASDKEVPSSIPDFGDPESELFEKGSKL